MQPSPSPKQLARRGLCVPIRTISVHREPVSRSWICTIYGHNCKSPSLLTSACVTREPTIGNRYAVRSNRALCIKTKYDQRPSLSFQPTPDEINQRFEVFCFPDRGFRIRVIEMASPPTWHHHLGRRPMNLHGCIASPFHRIPTVGLDVIRSDQGKEGNDLQLSLAKGQAGLPYTHSDIRGYKVSSAEGRDKCTPVIEQDEENAKYKSVICAEQLAVCTVRILLVVSIERSAILQCVVFSCRFNPVVELDIS